MDDTQTAPSGESSTAADVGSRRVGPLWRHRWRLGGAAVLVVLLVLASAWPALSDDRPRASAGTIYESGFSMPTVHHASVRVPWGRVQLDTTTPRTSLPDDVATYEAGGNVAPPSGGRFVGVTWSAGSVVAVAPVRLTGGANPRTHLWLVADGTTYPLDRPAVAHAYCATQVCLGRYGANRAWVAVPGDASDVRIAVGFDGVTQTVDMADGHVTGGRAAELARARTTSPDCGEPTWTAGFTGRMADCSVSLERTPYIVGPGWAPAGRLWLAASVTTFRPYEVTYRRGSRPSRFFADSGTTVLSYSVAGGRQLVARSDKAGDGEIGTPIYADIGGEVVIFSIPAGSRAPLVVHDRWALDPQATDGRTSAATSYVTATWTVR